jgi:hypothetical protein
MRVLWIRDHVRSWPLKILFFPCQPCLCGELSWFLLLQCLNSFLWSQICSPFCLFFHLHTWCGSLVSTSLSRYCHDWLPHGSLPKEGLTFNRLQRGWIPRMAPVFWLVRAIFWELFFNLLVQGFFFLFKNYLNGDNTVLWMLIWLFRNSPASLGEMWGKGKQIMVS